MQVTAQLWEEPGLIDPEIVAISEVRERAADQLRRHVVEVMSIDEATLREDELYHRGLARVRGLCAAVLGCEEAELTHEEIVQILEPVRRVHAQSPFVSRLQQWPRGYPGDFETVEYLVSGRNRAVGA